MAAETIYETHRTRSRDHIASYLRLLAEALEDDDPVPVPDDGTVRVQPPPDFDLGVEVERTDGTLAFGLEMAWPERDGDVETEAPASKARFELYEDAAGQWRWRLVHDNGNIIADSGEGYASKQKATQGLESVRQNVPGAPTERLD